MIQRGKNFEIVRASAGSGKTYRLVLMYLECALQYEDPRSFRRILALTFTNKAAAEMKSRILEDLEKLSLGESDKLSMLSELLSLSPIQVKHRSALLHKEMLHRYSDISVMTIDKFINRLVKSFARDLALEQDYRIEIDANKVLEEAVSQLLEKLGSPGNNDLTSLLKSFALNRVDDDQDAGVRRPLTQLGRTLMQEKMSGVIELLSDINPTDFKRISNELRKKNISLEKNFYSKVDLALAKIKALNIPEDDFPKTGNIFKILRDLRYVKIADPTKTFDKIYSDPRAMVKKGVSEESKVLADSVGSYIVDVYETLEKLRPGTDDGKTYILSKKLNKRIALMGTLSALHQEIEQVQIDNNIRTFHAMHERISDIVKDNYAPFIYERLGSRYNHIFMDEFQDTSITQWHNLVVLYDHAISQGHKTLVVGDGKQAIYRFRNGDYKQLMDLPKLQPGYSGPAIKDAEETFEREKNISSLDYNFRSGREIVKWNNELFVAISEFISPDLKEVYGGLVQTPKTEFNGGVYLDYAVEKTKEDRRKIYTQKIIDRIHFYDGLKYERGDITILVRDNETGSNLAQDLLANDIKPMTEESLQLGRHPGPQAIVALMRWILRPTDFRQSAIILQCACAMSNGELNESEILGKVVKQVEFVREDGTKGKKAIFDTESMLSKVFPKLELKDKTTGPLAAFVGHACEAFGLTSKYPAYAEGMMELARKVSRVDENGIHGFLKVWDLDGKDKSIVTSKSKEAVQIMTVHKAKGLAFKIVITLISAREFNKFSGVIPVDLSVGSNLPLSVAMMEDGDMKDTILEPQRLDELNRVLLDNMNTTYVALTRPVERLDVILELEKMDFKEPHNMSELVVLALEKAYGKEVIPGDQTSNFSAKVDKDPQEKSHISMQPEVLKTGASIDQIVIVSDSETVQSKPQGMTSRELGLEVHRILECVKTVDDWTKLKNELSSGMSISSEDAQIIMSRVDSVISGDLTGKYFAKGLHVETEQSIVTSDGEIIRPDRIINDGKVWTVIDYKSSTEGETKHKKQVEKYCSFLSDIEGTKVEGVIIYTDPLKLLKVV